MTEEALVEDDEIELPPDARSSRNVRVAERHNGRMRLEVSIDHPGLLVVSDGFYPGWRARVGERSVPIHRVNHMMRGVVVPAGHHEVELEFRSRVILWGFVLSALGVGAWVAMAMLAWRRSNAVQPGVEP
jgi:uncharacterized membrane protein YfhO